METQMQSSVPTPQPTGEEEETVQVPLFSRFIFPSVHVTPTGDRASDEAAAIAVVRARLGTDTDLMCVMKEGEDGHAISVRDVPGRDRVPRGTHAAPQSEWRGVLVLPPLGEGIAEREIPIEEVDMTAGEIVAAGGRVVVVIKLLWDEGDASAQDAAKVICSASSHVASKDYDAHIFTPGSCGQGQG
jgi:hypothetical protein